MGLGIGSLKGAQRLPALRIVSGCFILAASWRLHAQRFQPMTDTARFPEGTDVTVGSYDPQRPQDHGYPLRIARFVFSIVAIGGNPATRFPEMSHTKKACLRDGNQDERKEVNKPLLDN